MDIEKLTARLVEVVQETMQPEHVSLWLKLTADRRPQTADGGRPSAVGGRTRGQATQRREGAK